MDYSGDWTALLTYLSVLMVQSKLVNFIIVKLHLNKTVEIIRSCFTL